MRPKPLMPILIFSVLPLELALELAITTRVADCTVADRRIPAPMCAPCAADRSAAKLGPDGRPRRTGALCWQQAGFRRPADAITALNDCNLC